MSIWIVLFIGICFLFFYYFILSTFVHFMNRFILVPPQILINHIINFLNSGIRQVNGILNGIRNLNLGIDIEIDLGSINLPLGIGKVSLGKVPIKAPLYPFKSFWKQDPIPIIKPHKIKCIREPVGYKTIFKYKTPKECPKKSNKKKKKKIAEQAVSSLMNGFIIILLGSLLVLLWFGMQDVDKPTKIEGSENPLLNNNSSSNLIGENLLSSMATTGVPPVAIPSSASNMASNMAESAMKKIPSSVSNMASNMAESAMKKIPPVAIPSSVPKIPPVAMQSSVPKIPPVAMQSSVPNMASNMATKAISGIPTNPL